MTKKQKKTLKRIIISAVLYLAIILASKLVAIPWYLELVLFLVPYFIIGHDVLRKAVLGIVHGEVFDENFLMAVATLQAAFTICSDSRFPLYFSATNKKPIKGPQPYSLGISSRLVNVQKAAASSSRKATRALSLFSKSFGSIFSAPKMLLLSMGSLLQKRWSHPTVHGRVPLR